MQENKESVPPSRTVDTLVTQNWPFPVAIAWHRVLQSRDASLRAQAAGAAAEALLRTICMFALPDHLSLGADERVMSRIPALDRPSLGHWVSLVRELSRVSGERENAFISELHSAFFDAKGPSAASRALDEVVTLRNQIAHGASVSETEVSVIADKMVHGLRAVLEAWGWVSGYRIFRVRGERRTRRGTVEGRIQFYAGRDSTPEDVQHEWVGELVADAVYVAHPTGERVLEVSPLMLVRVDPGVRDDRPYLFKETVRGKKLRLVNEETGHVHEDGVLTERGSLPWDGWLAAVEEHRGPLVISRGVEGFRAQTRNVAEDDLGGRYEVRGTLGEGAMGIVLRVWDPAWNQEYALKVSRAELSSDAAFRERFRREAMLMRGMQHPNILTIEDVFDLPDGRVCIKMPVVEGGSLADKVVAGGQPEAAVLRWGEQALDALVHLHAAGIVHRDIKPANILLTVDDVILVTDFGVALRESEARLTRAAESLGTSAYMAPEQARAGGKISGKADVYALALVLHELRTGETRGSVAGKGIAGPLGKLLQRMGRADVDERMDAVQALSALRALGARAPVPVEATTGPVAPTVASPNANQEAPAASGPTAPPAGRSAARFGLWAAGVCVAGLAGWLALRGPTCSWDGAVATGPLAACVAHGATLPKAEGLALQAALCARDAAIAPTTVLPLCTAAAEALALGKDIELDAAGAVRLRDLACRAGDPLSCRSAGAAWSTGTSVSKDMAAAARAWSAGCALKDAASCRGMGVLLLNGWGVEQDAARGLTLLDAACTGGDAKGCFQLAQELESTDERPRIATLYGKACELGDKVGCMNLGVMTIRGDGVPVDVAAGEALRARACGPELKEACSPL